MFKRLGVDWGGCVEAREGLLNLSDDAPDLNNPKTLFVPYFAPDEPGVVASLANSNSGDKFNNSYLPDDKGPASAAEQKKEQMKVDKYNLTISRRIENDLQLTSTLTRKSEHKVLSMGPNRSCPTPIVPLTEDLDSLQIEIGKMRAWSGSGTNVSEGLAWGRRVLSPGEPYTEGQPFKDENVSKWVVLFTDGTNEVYGASGTLNKSDYSAYGFLSESRMGADKSKAITQVNTWTSTMCTDLKKQDVQIFTILLGADSAANRKLYGDCASKPEYYFGTNDPSKLKEIFNGISSIIAALQFTG
jgi:hypothetical protein